MENFETYFKLGTIAALSATQKTLSLYPNGMTGKEVADLIDELDQQLGIRQTEMQLLKRA